MRKRFCQGCEKTPLRSDNVTGLCTKCIRSRATHPRGKPSLDSLDVKGDSATLTKGTRERVRTLEDLIRVCQIDTSVWTIERWVCNSYEMGAKDAEGNTTSQPLYQVKAFLKSNAIIQGVKEEIASLIADAKSRLQSVNRQTGGRPDEGHRGGVLLEIAIPDLHLGKLAWAPETGYSDYDLKIAEKLFDDALAALLARTKHFPVAKIVFPLGNDILHSDTKQGTTSKGTPLDTDSRYHKAFAVGRRMASRAIERLRQIAPVDVILVPGNHDVLSVYHLGDSLTCLFHDVEGITIDNEPRLRKYYQYGATALMFTHGDKGKSADWPLLFATEQPKMFGSAKYREIHTGHYHQTKTSEHHGVRVRVSPALCPPDAWHADNQFVGAVRGAEAYVYDQTEGLVSIAYFNVEDV